MGEPPGKCYIVGNFTQGVPQGFPQGGNFTQGFPQGFPQGEPPGKSFLQGGTISAGVSPGATICFLRGGRALLSLGNRKIIDFSLVL